MTPLLWILLGMAIGALLMLPAVHALSRRAERRARSAERRARESERLAELGSMTGGLAHEIKNPLSTIGLNAQLLAEGLADATISEQDRGPLVRRLDALAREAERLKGILTDFLQFAGRMNLDPQPQDLGRVVTEVTDFFHPQCDQASIVLRTQLPPGPVEVRVDERLLKQALLNLMINAVQAMSGPSESADPSNDRPNQARGELLVRVSADDAEAHVHVTDTGPGIEPERLAAIFHPYVTHRTGGTGLGLPTARRIIEEHGGRIEAHSEIGRGSDFVIHMKRDAATERRSDGGGD